MFDTAIHNYSLTLKMKSSAKYGKSILPIILMAISVVLSGCGSTIIPYQSSAKMTLDEAKNTTEELIMTQHPNWKPDNFIARDDYMLWGYGQTSNQHGFATVLGNTNTAFGSSTTTTRDVGKRVYYKNIQEIQLMSWYRKFKKWYVVSLKSNNEITRILYTRNYGDAKRLVDSVSVLKKELTNPDVRSLMLNSSSGKNSGNLEKSADDRLKSLKDLYNKGVISDYEYSEKRQKIIDEI